MAITNSQSNIVLMARTCELDTIHAGGSFCISVANDKVVKKTRSILILIMTIAHGKPEPTAVFLGSITQYMSHRTGSPILIVKFNDRKMTLFEALLKGKKKEPPEVPQILTK